MIFILKKCKLGKKVVENVLIAWYQIQQLFVEKMAKIIFYADFFFSFIIYMVKEQILTQNTWFSY